MQERRFTRKRRSLRIPIYKLKRQHSKEMNGSTSFQNSTTIYEDCSDSDSKLQSHSLRRRSFHKQLPHQHRSQLTVCSTSSSHHKDFTNESCLSKFWNCLIGSSNYRTMKMMQSGGGMNSVSKIDTVARVLFPLTFLSFHIFYWISYLKTGEVRF